MAEHLRSPDRQRVLNVDGELEGLAEAGVHGLEETLLYHLDPLRTSARAEPSVACERSGLSAPDRTSKVPVRTVPAYRPKDSANRSSSE